MRRLTDHRRLLGNLTALVLSLLWFLALAPTAIGGDTSYIRVSGHSMDGTYATDDLVVQRRQDTYAVGDIIAFRAQGGRVIHRIIGGNGTDGYVTQGDNNAYVDPWHPTDADVLGRSWLRLPGAARLLDLPADPVFAGVIGGLAGMMVALKEPSKPSSTPRRRLTRSGGRS